MRLPTRAAALAATILAMASVAKAEQIQLDGIVVTTTKTEERAIDSLSASSSIGGRQAPRQATTAGAPPVAAAAEQAPLGASGTTDRSYIEQSQPNSVSELLRDVPGVETSDNHNDPAQSIGIRGLQDFGQVNVMVDGARQDFQVTGHGFGNAFILNSRDENCVRCRTNEGTSPAGVVTVPQLRVLRDVPRDATRLVDVSRCIVSRRAGQPPPRRMPSQLRR